MTVVGSNESNLRREDILSIDKLRELALTVNPPEDPLEAVEFRYIDFPSIHEKGEILIMNIEEQRKIVGLTKLPGDPDVVAFLPVPIDIGVGSVSVYGGFLCTVCHLNPVDALGGFDTCRTCRP